MSTTIDLTLINGISGDPAVCAAVVQAGESLLFDAGSLEIMSNRELLKVRVVAISHTHVDHFIGFDRLIRVNIPHFRTIEVVGPTHIHANVMAKLRAYTWNLLEPSQINYIVHEVSQDGMVRTFQLTNDNHFQPVLIQTTPAPVAPSLKIKIPLRQIQTFSLSAATLDHGVPVLAYFMQLPDQLIVDKIALAECGHEAGPWIAELQKLASENALQNDLQINGVSVSAADLASKLLRPRSGDSVLYVTDIIFNASNLAAIESLCGGSAGRFVCEANYRDSDRKKAFAKSHLTTKQAALIAAKVRAKELIIFHVSNIYAGDIETSAVESASMHETYRRLTSEELLQACQGEFPT